MCDSTVIFFCCSCLYEISFPRLLKERDQRKIRRDPVSLLPLLLSFQQNRQNYGLGLSVINQRSSPHFYLDFPLLCSIGPDLLHLASLPRRLYPQCGTLSWKGSSGGQYSHLMRPRLLKPSKHYRKPLAFTFECDQAKLIPVSVALLKLSHLVYHRLPFGCLWILLLGPSDTIWLPSVSSQTMLIPYRTQNN